MRESPKACPDGNVANPHILEAQNKCVVAGVMG